jgi:hypothetical protein
MSSGSNVERVTAAGERAEAERGGGIGFFIPVRTAFGRGIIAVGYCESRVGRIEFLSRFPMKLVKRFEDYSGQGAGFSCCCLCCCLCCGTNGSCAVQVLYRIFGRSSVKMMGGRFEQRRGRGRTGELGMGCCSHKTARLQGRGAVRKPDRVDRRDFCFN